MASKKKPLFRIKHPASTPPAVNGDDLAGVVEIVRSHLTPYARGPFKIALYEHGHYLGRVKAGYGWVDVYGDKVALGAARALRRETIRALAAAVGKADGLLGTDHPLRRYLDTVREGCGPEMYRRDGVDYESVAMRGCDLRCID